MKLARMQSSSEPLVGSGAEVVEGTGARVILAAPAPAIFP